MPNFVCVVDTSKALEQIHNFQYDVSEMELEAPHGSHAHGEATVFSRFFYFCGLLISFVWLFTSVITPLFTPLFILFCGLLFWFWLPLPFFLAAAAFFLYVCGLLLLWLPLPFFGLLRSSGGFFVAAAGLFFLRSSYFVCLTFHLC